MIHHLPVDGYGHQRKDRGTDAEHRYELRYLAVDLPEYPIAVQHIVVVEGHVQAGDHRIGYGEVHCKQNQTKSTKSVFNNCNTCQSQQM